MNFALNVFFSSLEFTAIIILSLSLFRFQFYYYLHKIYGIALAISLVAFIFREIEPLSDLTTITIITIEVVLIMIVYRIPFFYSILVCVPGFLLSATIEVTFATLGTRYGILSTNFAKFPLTLAVVQLSTGLVMLLFAYLLQRRKFGFLFKSKNLTTKSALKGYNFLLTTILVIIIGFTQMVVVWINHQSVSSYIAVISALTIMLLLIILTAYRHNKKIIHETYERPVLDELHRSTRTEKR